MRPNHATKVKNKGKTLKNKEVIATEKETRNSKKKGKEGQGKALRDILMPRGKDWLLSVSRQFLTRNCPQLLFQNCPRGEANCAA